MKVIVCHNFYQQPGGEDQVFADETELLRSRGHEVLEFTRHNDEIEQIPRLRLATESVWNRRVANELADQVHRFGADVVHFHNTLPLISPAAIRAARRAGAATVVTLHNYRMMCPKATFFRDGKTCQSCLGKVPFAAVKHACYRDSHIASAMVSTLLVTHRLLKTYSQHVDAYISLCNFARDKHIEAGLPESRLELKPNFLVQDSEPGTGAGKYLMFLGRLSEEKGIQTLLDTWVQHAPPIPLLVVGDGPQRDLVTKAMDQSSMIRWEHGVAHGKVLELLGGAAAMVLPSVNFEGFPKTIVESFAMGTPVIGSRMGAMEELIEPGKTGFHFQPGNTEDLANVVSQAIADPQTLAVMRQPTRQTFEQHYTADANYQTFMQIYERAMARRAGANVGVPERSERSPETPHPRSLDASLAAQQSCVTNSQLS